MLDIYSPIKHAFNQIKQRMVSLKTIEQKSFSVLKVILILLAIFFIIIATFWIFDREDGIVVQPFETVGSGENLDGKPLATLLSFDLQRIKNIYAGQDIPVISKSNIGNSIVPRPLADFSIPPLSIKNIPLEYSLSQIGTVGAEGTSISIGNMLLSMKEFLGNRANTITCSLQRYNSTIIILAILKDQTYNKKDIMTFEVTKNISNAEQIPDLINDLAFQISLALSKRGVQPKEEDPYPQNWQTFKYVTQGRDAYNSYIITKDTNDLDKGCNMALSAKKFEPGYNGTYELISGLGFAYLQSEKYNEAENIFRNITDFKPFESALGLGLVYFYKNDYTEALAAFDEATQLNPKDSLAWDNKGVILNKMGKFNESIKAFANSTGLDQQNAKAWYNKGNALAQLGQKENNSSRYESAIQAYNEAIEIKSQDPAIYVAAWTGKGNALNALGKYNESLEAYDKAIVVDPQHATAWHNKGVVLYKLGRPEEAIRALDKAIQIDPKLAQPGLKKKAKF